jgi:hypothetical protein
MSLTRFDRYSSVMSKVGGLGSSRFLLGIVVVVIGLGFSPISRALLNSVNGSFSPTSYSSLALKDPTDATISIVAGKSLPVLLTNRTGHSETYHWSATQDGSLISLGEQALDNGRSTTILVPSRGATSGTLRVTLTGTNIFLTVPILKS